MVSNLAGIHMETKRPLSPEEKRASVMESGQMDRLNHKAEDIMNKQSFVSPRHVHGPTVWERSPNKLLSLRRSTMRSSTMDQMNSMGSFRTEPRKKTVVFQRAFV